MSVQPTFDIYGFEYQAVRLRNRLYFRLGPKDDRDARKIFVAGHPRTGTGTLHRIFVANGLDSSHTAGTWKTARHDCFSDRGNYQPLARFADWYRNAEFVLNTRPAWKYLKSRMNQTVKKRTNQGLLQPRFTARNVANEILRRNNHFLDCVRLFDFARRALRRRQHRARGRVRIHQHCAVPAIREVRLAQQGTTAAARRNRCTDRRGLPPAGCRRRAHEPVHHPAAARR
ncbi:MAG: hypothetical protein U5K33_04825 [Halofilum sp. (in: g-proteobacteria)]|nr:hypothetical protein [Halofilum sp. (in: g-proteobacteria)]